jgi:hypothetical protein
VTDDKHDSRKLYPGWFIQRMADRSSDARQTPSDVKGQPLSRKHRPPVPGQGSRPATAGGQSHYRPRQSPPPGESKHAPGGFHQLSSKNIYGLTSRSEQFYPSAFKPIEDRYWDDLTDIERNELARRRIEVMRKVTYREFEGLPRNLTAAEEAYEDAQVRRHNAMRRRFTKKPRNYDERKKWEEEQRKAPLVRKYVFREMSHLEPTAFYKPGALETPVLIESQIIGQAKKKQQEDEPKVLKIRRMKRLAAKHRQETLPTANIKGKPQVGISDYVNNPYGLRSRSVTSYPEAYQSVSSVFYQQMSREEQARIARVQAQAMEKVGFEPKTHKQFIDDFDPMEQNIYDPGTWEPPAENEAARGGYNPYDQSVSLQNRYSTQQFESAPKRKTIGYRPPRIVRVIGGIALVLFSLGLGFSATAPGASAALYLAAVAGLIAGLILIFGRYE